MTLIGITASSQVTTRLSSRRQSQFDCMLVYQKLLIQDQNASKILKLSLHFLRNRFWVKSGENATVWPGSIMNFGSPHPSNQHMICVII